MFQDKVVGTPVTKGSLTKAHLASVTTSPEAPEKKIKLDPRITGNVGLYYCSYRLSLLGWNVMPTTRNARGIDIIAYNDEGSSFLKLQVKTLSKRNPVPLGQTLDNIMGDFLVIINNVATEPKVFILRPSEVRKRARHTQKDGRDSYWLQPTDYEERAFREAWGRIGYGYAL